MDISTQTNYDNFLIIHKQNRIKRIGKFISRSTCIDHECQDEDCKRIWKPKPSQMLKDDYYCPYCVLHHRNNMKRFDIERLKWTKTIPNTFYVFEIIDPNNKNLKIVKFGRTQHENVFRRYPTKELKDYNMKLICCLRGNLITMTRIENFWKTKAKQLNIFHDFSIGTFHGKAECVLADKYLNNLLNSTRLINDDNSDDPNNDGFEFDFE